MGVNKIAFIWIQTRTAWIMGSHLVPSTLTLSGKVSLRTNASHYCKRHNYSHKLRRNHHKFLATHFSK